MSCLSAVPSAVVTEFDYDNDNAVMSPYVRTLYLNNSLHYKNGRRRRNINDATS